MHNAPAVTTLIGNLEETQNADHADRVKNGLAVTENNGRDAIPIANPAGTANGNHGVTTTDGHAETVNNARNDMMAGIHAEIMAQIGDAPSGHATASIVAEKGANEASPKPTGMTSDRCGAPTTTPRCPNTLHPRISIRQLGTN